MIGLNTMTKQGFKIHKNIFNIGVKLLFLIFVPLTLGAIEPDELKKQLRSATEINQKANLAEEIASSYFNTSHDSVFKYFALAEGFANKSETKEDNIKVCRSFAYFHTHRTNDFAEANKHYLKALKIAELSENLLEQALIYNDLGIVGWKQGKYLEAVENYYKANELLSKVEDSDLEMRISLSLGIVHNESAMNDEAKVFYARGLEIAEQNDNQKAIGMFLNNLGKIHRDLEEYELSLKYFGRADSLFKAQKNPYWQCFARYNLGYTNIVAGNLDEAKLYLDSARILNAPFDNVFMDLMIDCEVAKIAEEKGQYSKALKLAQTALQKLEALDTDLFYVKIYPILAKCYEELGNAKSAVDFYKKSNEATTKSDATDKQNELIKRNALIEYKKKTLEIERLKMEVEKENAQFRKTLGYLLLALLAILLLLTLGGLFFYRMRLSQLQKYEHLRTELTQDLHDNVGSSLNQIKMLAARLRPSKTEKESTEEVKKVARIKNISDELIGNMQDLVWSVDPGNDSLEALIHRMRDHTSNVFSNLELPYRMKVNGKHENIILDPEAKSNLYSLFKEAINNITKHTRPETILIKIDIIDRNFNLHIENGKEIVVDSKYSTGKGLPGMKARAEKLGGVLEVEDLTDRFIVKLKVSL